MRLNADSLVLAYLGYRSPAGDLFQVRTLVREDGALGILPHQRETDISPGSRVPHGDSQAESKLPGPGPDSVPSEGARTPQQALPLPEGSPENRQKNIDEYVMNAPDSEPGSRERDRPQVTPRPVPQEGEQYGTPTKFDYGAPTRIPKEGQSVGFPKDRQRDQRGKSERESRKWYRRNRQQHRRKMQRRQRRLRTNPQYRRQRKLRRKHPRRFQRRPGGGFRSPAQRSQKWRQEKKLQEQQRRADYVFDPSERESGFPFMFGRDLVYGEIDGFGDGTVQFTLFPEFEDYAVMGAPEAMELPPLEFLAHAVFDDDRDLGYVLDAIEEEFGPEVWEQDPEDIESPWLDEESLVKAASWHTHVFDQGPAERAKTRDQRKDEQDEAEYSENRLSGVPRGTPETPTTPNAPGHWPSEMTRQPYEDGRPDRAHPATSLTLTPVRDNPGSGQVIPWNSDSENKQDRTLTKGPGQPPPVSASSRTADTIGQILRRTAPKVKERAREYSPRITGVDQSKGLWFFETGDYFQRLRAKPKGREERVDKMDVLVSCSCPFWRWQGPEHWAKENEYLYDKSHTKGTATYPKIRDPKFRHAVCKHLTAVLNMVRSEGLKFTPKRSKRAGFGLHRLRYLLDSAGEVEVERYLSPEILVARYLGQPHGTNAGESP